MATADHDLDALGRMMLIPRLLHDVAEVDSGVQVLRRRLSSPILPRISAESPLPEEGLALADASRLRPSTGAPPARSSGVLPMLPPGKMGELIPEVRRLVALDVPALVLDLSSIADSAPYGAAPWRPRTREDLAELVAAAGCPVWLYGVLSPDDATVAAEAGVDAVVVHAGVARYLGGPATIDALPDVIDAVAGMLAVHAGGPVRSGVDVYRYLAVGAEAVVVESDRSLQALEAELHYAMRLTGCAVVADIGYDAIFAPTFDDT